MNLTWATRDQGGDGPSFLSQRPRSRGERMGQGTCWCCKGKTHRNTWKHLHCLAFIYLTLFQLLICFLYFWIEAASLFLTMDPKISETPLRCLFEALHEAPGLGKTAMLAEFARFCIYPGAMIEIDSDRPCFSVQRRPKGTRTEQARVICTRK